MGKNIYFKGIVIFFFFVALFPGTVKAQTEIVFVYDPTRTNTLTGVNPDEEITVAILRDAGYEVTMFPVVLLSSATKEQIDTLNNAALVYIGRAVASTNFQDPEKIFWNEITAPIMTGNMWALRNTRMNWFNMETIESVNDYGLEDIVQADIWETDDPVFQGIDDSPIDWWIGPYNAIAPDDAGNGQVLAVETNGNNPVFVRWEKDNEFYPGSGDMPFGPRTFFGLDGDGATDADGNTLWQYSKYTELGMQVFLNEVAYLTGNLDDHSSSRKIGLDEFVSFNQTNRQLNVSMDYLAKIEVIDLSGRRVYALYTNNDRANVDLSFAKSGLHVVRLINNSNQYYIQKILIK